MYFFLSNQPISNFFENLTPTSIYFFVFAGIVLGFYYLFPKYQTEILFFSSFIFCLTWKWAFAFVLFSFSVINYFVALKISVAEKIKKKYWLRAGILVNIIGVATYKIISQNQPLFSRALVRSNFNDGFFEDYLLMPIGISFYTLQAISYFVDLYRGQIHVNKNFLEVSLYFSYFPKLLAGPIERAGPFFDQLKARRTVDKNQITESLLRIFIGLCRKFLISETITQKIPPDIFAVPDTYPTIELFFWWFAISFMIYNDFAGYTSIVRGVSGLFGIHLSRNFEQPFFSTSYINFWNRWHISLSNWLRDYIYLPVSRFMLRRNPSGKYIPNLIVPPIITMLISGFWHGFAPNFILWGFVNGVLQAFERIQRSFKFGKAKTNIAVLSFLLLFIINIPFRFSITQSLVVWSKLISWSNSTAFLSLNILKPILACTLSLFIDYIEIRTGDETGFLYLNNKVKVILLALALLLLFVSTRQHIPAPFIYQEF